MPTSIKNPLDDKVRKLFQACAKPKASPSERERARTMLAELPQNIKEPYLVASIQKIADYFLTRDRLREIGQLQEVPLEAVFVLSDGGYAAAVQFVLEDSPNAFDGLSNDDVIARPLSPKLLEKMAKDRKEFLGEAIEDMKVVSASEESLALDWLIEKAPPKQLLSLTPILASSKPRRVGLKSFEELRARYLERDKSGGFLRALLEGIRSSEIPTEILVSSLQGSVAAGEGFLSQCRKLLTTNHAETAVLVLKNWLSTIANVEPKHRERLSAALIEFFAHLLKKPKRKASTEAALHAVSNAMEALRAQTDSDKHGFWIVTEAATTQQPVGEAISLDGARLLVESFDKMADPQFSPGAVIHTLALNLGLVPIGQFQEIVAYDPANHQDTEGGLFRGEPCRIIAEGWSLGPTVLAKARVKKEV